MYSAYVHVAKTHNLRAPTPKEVREQMGNPLPDIFKSFYPDEDIASLLSTNSTFIAANTIKSEAFNGVEELLETLSELDIKMAILTSGGPKIIDILKRHNLDHYFTSVVHHERITHPKPHSEGFLLACNECDVIPSEAVMVGDTTIDIETGKNAGALKTIALTHGFGSRLELEKAEADFVVDNLPQVAPIIRDLLKEQLQESIRWT